MTRDPRPPTDRQQSEAPDLTPSRLWVRDAERGWLRFAGRRRVIAAHHVDEVAGALEAVRSALADGQWAVGYIAYDAAPGIDPGLVVQSSHGVDGPPLMWWSVGQAPSQKPSLETGLEPESDSTSQSRIVDLDWLPRVDADEHRHAVEAVRRRIAAGDTYQANLTFQLTANLRSDTAADAGPTSIDPWLLFRHLQATQQADYAAYLDIDDEAGDARWAVCCASPELFFEHEGERLRVRPMKGTAPRGRHSAEDEARRGELRSAKNRAENLMITDMMRNDLGRVARPGSVQVTKLFAEETYPTVHQLVSEVIAETSHDSVDVLRALFPCASITGAPKRSSMAIIAEVEHGPRGLYTGAIGWLSPNRSRRRAQLAVAIRTAVVDRQHQTASFGTGGGIVWDSRADLEYAECRTKARILEVAPQPAVELFETLLWRPRSGFARLERHLERLGASARYFGVDVDVEAARAALESAVGGAKAGDTLRQRVRLDLANGRVTATAQPWPWEGRRVWSLVLDDRPVHASDITLFHKTTDRRRYDDAFARARARFGDSVDEVILWNDDGWVTEGTRTNLVVRLGERWLTPALDCGLLPGIYRQVLLESERIEEAMISVDDVSEARDVMLVNSLRGRLRARWIEASVP